MTLLGDVRAAIMVAVPAETEVFDSNFEEPNPNNCITLYNTGGPMATLSLDNQPVQQDTEVQLRFRDASQANLQARMEAMYAALVGWVAYAPAYMRLKASSQPFYQYPKDQRNRSIGSFNVTVKPGR